MLALSLALALATAPGPAIAPVPVYAPAAPRPVPPTLIRAEAGPAPGAPAVAGALAPASALPAAPAAGGPAPTPPAATGTPSGAPLLPQAAVEKIGQGDRAFLAGDYRGALFAYQDAVYLAPKSPAAHVKLGRAYLALRYPPQAIAQAEQALALDPEHADARRLLEDAKGAPSRPAASAPAAGQAAAPASPMPAAAAPRIFRFTPEPETPAAVEDAPAAAAPAAPAAAEAPARARPPAESDAAARREVERIEVGSAKLDRPAPDPGAPREPPAGPTAGQRYRTALELLAKREFEKAVEELTQAIVIDPRLAVAYAARASARFGLGRYREAADDYQASLTLDENLGTPLYGLAECYRVLGDGRRASEMYQRYADSRAADVREDLRAISARRAQELR